MFILNSIPSTLDSTLLTTLPSTSSSIGVSQKYSVTKPERLSLPQDKSASSYEKENVKQINIQQAPNTIPLSLDKKHGLIESIYYNICNAIAARRSSFISQETMSCRGFFNFLIRYS